jgi:cell division protein FtsW
MTTTSMTPPDTTLEKRFAPDWVLFVVTLMLLGLGIVMVYDASYPLASAVDYTGRDPMYFLKRQAIWGVLGVVGMFGALSIPYWKLVKIANWGLVLTILMLIAVLAMGHGAQGAQRWIGYGPIRLQPSEFAKLTILLYLARVIAARPFLPRRLFGEGFVPLLVIPLTVFVLVERQPDLGTALTLLLTVLSVLFAGGVKKRHLAGLLAFFFIAGLGFAIHKGTDSYRWKRVLTFVDPDMDPRGAGYQIKHSLLALGTGGVTGVGFGESREKQFGNLPAQRTDFIFAIVGEEFGLAGTCGVLFLFTVLAMRGFHIAARCRDPFGALLATGITGMITVQTLINIAVVTASVPATGVPLPFLSYGGSSLVLTMVSIGILLNISQYPFNRESRQALRAARRSGGGSRSTAAREAWN